MPTVDIIKTDASKVSDDSPVLDAEGQKRIAIRNIVILNLVLFANWFSYSLYIPYSRDFIKEKGRELPFVGIVLAAHTLPIALFTIPFSKLSDICGRRPIILFGCGAALCTCLFFLAVTEPWHILVVRATLGFCCSNVGAVYAAVADVAPPNKRAGVFALLNIGPNVGLLTGMIVGVSLSTKGLKTLSLINQYLFVLCSVLVFFVFRDRLPRVALAEFILEIKELFKKDQECQKLSDKQKKKLKPTKMKKSQFKECHSKQNQAKSDSSVSISKSDILDDSSTHLSGKEMVEGFIEGDVSHHIEANTSRIATQRKKITSTDLWRMQQIVKKVKANEAERRMLEVEKHKLSNQFRWASLNIPAFKPLLFARLCIFAATTSMQGAVFVMFQDKGLIIAATCVLLLSFMAPVIYKKVRDKIEAHSLMFIFSIILTIVFAIGTIFVEAVNFELPYVDPTYVFKFDVDFFGIDKIEAHSLMFIFSIILTIVFAIGTIFVEAVNFELPYVDPTYVFKFDVDFFGMLLIFILITIINSLLTSSFSDIWCVFGEEGHRGFVMGLGEIAMYTGRSIGLILVYVLSDLRHTGVFGFLGNTVLSFVGSILVSRGVQITVDESNCAQQPIAFEEEKKSTLRFQRRARRQRNRDIESNHMKRVQHLKVAPEVIDESSTESSVIEEAERREGEVIADLEEHASTLHAARAVLKEWGVFKEEDKVIY
ncbi:Major facilitator superfamily like protein [Aduncisulcus paluster]|uniref:Major facilitator superfamily like protein n=1 Tax=Aduncisulcus paluster TaxID=2918883 RepID=A0ABQ5KA50_9EUKA|nr:Major facilitator superfamily like protein [Aduncisulcus paluster]